MRFVERVSTNFCFVHFQKISLAPFIAPHAVLEYNESIDQLELCRPTVFSFAVLATSFG